ncbi:hypothetical protein [Vaginisenegalia massiliensis]|uniref:hypothetical protein n=1 Tax=Vaginisenegalia massiliensis TaxID=2058294 RepID=UPI000F54952E|nr:hypothetical protein [Vaginisenegalia massiliensis]
MKSLVQSYFPYEEIPVPEAYLTVEIPSWEAVAQPTIDQAIQYIKSDQEELANVVLTDEMVANLQLPNIQTVNQLKSFAMDTFKVNQIQRKFYQEVMPFILTFHAETASLLFNEGEFEDYWTDYLAKVQAYADEMDMSLSDYTHEQLGLKGQAESVLKERAEEDFIFKLIAQAEYEKLGLTLTEEDYQVFIQRNILHRGADEIEIRDRFPYETFKEQMPEMMLSQRLYDYFKDKIQFKIKKADDADV